MKRRWEWMITFLITFVILTMYMIWSLPDPNQIKSSSQDHTLGQNGMIKIATYNIWNFMFHWDVRKLYIAKYITRELVDVIAFQEVREGEIVGNQLDHLQYLMPEYAYKAFFVATPQTDTGMKEGLGLLSRHPIISSDYVTLVLAPTDPDRNTRICLHALVDFPNIGPVHFFVFHISYEKMTQCRNIAEILGFLAKYDDQYPQFLLGDFNTYNEFEHPVNILQQLKSLDPANPCYYSALAAPQKPSKEYKDLWTLLHPESPKEEGYTFSNMPWPGKQSRPDRILLGDSRGCLSPLSIKHDANGTEYEAMYWKQVYLDRLWPLLTSTNFLLPIPFCLGIAWKRPRKYGIPFALLCMIVYAIIIKNEAVKGLMKEEFFSSDHDILIATLKSTC